MKCNFAFILSVFIALLFISIKTVAQNDDLSKNELTDWIDNQFEKGMKVFNIPGATFVLMRGDSVLHMRGYGVENMETKVEVEAARSIFHIASISKTFVAVAIMKLYQEGKVELDIDVNNYLRSFQLENNFGQAITLQHLLTHTAGFDERNMGTTVRVKEDVIPLADHLLDRMPPQIRKAGEALTYSNYGYALLGLIVEEVSGMPFEKYVTDKILEPLQMKRSGFIRQEKYKDDYVISYLQKGTQLIPQPLNFQLDFPPASFSSTSEDMSHYIAMFLNKGKFMGEQILDSATVTEMFNNEFQHFSESDVGWLLGFYKSTWKGLKLVEHDGDVQGFASELIMIPEKNLGLFLCVNGSRIPNSQSRKFMNIFIPRLWTKLIPEQRESINELSDQPIQKDYEISLDNFDGNYRFTRYAQKTIDKLSVLIGFAPEISISSEKDTLFIKSWDDRLIRKSEMTFYSPKFKKYMAFGKDENGKVKYFFPSGTSSYHKLKWFETVGFQTYWIGISIFVLLLSIIVNGIRLLTLPKVKRISIRRINFITSLLILLFIGMLAYILIKTDPQEYAYGIPPLLKVVLILPFIFAPLTFYGLWQLFQTWNVKNMHSVDKLFQYLITSVCILFLPWLWYWNLFGFNY